MKKLIALMTSALFVLGISVAAFATEAPKTATKAEKAVKTDEKKTDEKAADTKATDEKATKKHKKVVKKHKKAAKKAAKKAEGEEKPAAETK
ncbi:MAG: hypothetical protein M0024_11895 [Nitrospiraceae bacterium]|nr:hypothetical protein [Nitrospiraceae bacterium]